MYLIHYFSHCVTNIDWRVILWPDRPGEGSPEKDCYQMTTISANSNSSIDPYDDLRRTNRNVG